MKTVIDYINDLKEKTGSDYKTAKLLKIDKASLSVIRSKGRMADETAIKVAEALGVDETEVLIAAAVARSDGKVLSAWLKISKAVGAAASFLLAIQILSPIATYTKCILC
ncbi:hypothetical protein KFZ76_08605 [Methylovulum psychrotolerans]|uniref:hypothetical protein n=1 Tax=Methylovulum psychrotolerans TaxID=1704499 RepID=UPI001BFF8C1A|nr:hypothetical protein [Methylovulum psychrotolerans]MBT9097766.1 hypothetical protein [Methylovulum psychrotolerans]